MCICEYILKLNDEIEWQIIENYLIQFKVFWYMYAMLMNINFDGYINETY